MSNSGSEVGESSDLEFFDEEEEETKAEETVDRMKTLLSSYYGIDKKKDTEEEKTNMDSELFDVKNYVVDKIENNSLSDLIKINLDLTKNVTRYDTDMQSLIHQNYSKFIVATDTIREMKTEIDTLSVDISTLVEQSEKLEQFNNTINERLKEKRANIDKLVRVDRMLKKLQILFDLPISLRRCIELDEFSQAVKKYQAAQEVLNMFQHIQSLNAIRTECDNIVVTLISLLKDKLYEEDITYQQITETTSLLLKLHNNEDFYRKNYILWNVGRLRRILSFFGQEAPISEADQWELFSKLPYREFISNLNHSFLKKYSSFIEDFNRLFDCNKEISKSSLKELSDELLPIYFKIVTNKLESVSFSQDVTTFWKHKHPLYCSFGKTIEKVISDWRSVSVISNFKIILVESWKNHCRMLVEKIIKFQFDEAYAALKCQITDKLQTIIESMSNSSWEKSLEELQKYLFSTALNVLTNLKSLLSYTCEIIPLFSESITTYYQNSLHKFFLWIINVFGYISDPYFPGCSQGIVFSPENTIIYPPLFLNTKPIQDLRVPSCFYLFSYCMIQYMKENFIQELLQLLMKILSLTNANNLKEDLKIPALLQSLDFTEMSIIQTYVKMKAKDLLINFESYLSNIDVVEITHVSGHIMNLAQQLLLINEELKLFFPNSKKDYEPIWVISPFNPRVWDMNDEINSTQKPYQKDPVRLEKSYLFESILNIIIRSYLEVIRVCDLSTFGFQQVDVSFIQVILPLYIDNSFTIDRLLIDWEQSSYERCEVPLEMRDEDIINIIKSEYNKIS